MPGEKKIWRLSTPFQRGLFGKQNLPLGKAKVGHSESRNRVSSVYLSDGSSTSSFVVIHEFDDPIGSQLTWTHEESNYTSHPLKPSAVSSSTDGDDSSLRGCQLIGSQNDFRPAGCPYVTPVVNTSSGLDGDLARRLCAAYEYIRSMPFASPPKVVFSSDPQMLRKQLGVPQHSVLNYPVHSSLDLPNPHVSPQEPSPSPILPSTSSADAPYARSSTLGLHVNAATQSPSRYYCHSDASQITTQRKTMATTSPLIDSSPSQCSVFGIPWSPRTSSSQSYIPNPSKLSKHRVEKSVVSLSSLSSSYRNVLKGTLQNSPTDILSSSAPRKISLPQLRPPSPFRVNIPLHYTWHDRRTDFNFSPESRVGIDQSQGTKRRGTSGSTEILASLAWIGTPPMTSDSYAVDRKRQRTNSASFPHHFSMAIAVEDDSISDEVLVDQLEKVRRTCDEGRAGISPLRPLDDAHFPNQDENGLCDTPFRSSSPMTSDEPAKPYDLPLPSPLVSNGACSDSDSEDTEVWRAARKTLLCVREIIRTERKYQEALKMLLNAQTATPPPPSMSPHVSALVCASEMLLKCFLEDPSAWGVSTAFVASEDELEASMVSWCAVAGAFFTDADEPRSTRLAGKWRIRKSGVSSSSSSVTKEASTSLSPQLPPIFTVANPANEMNMNASKEYHTGWHKRERQIASVSKNNSAPTRDPPSRKLSVRDLAIQPIQRVMRYVLLYRDLLDCTPPTSPSRVLVERALEAATRIASHCDRAQRNPAFYRVS